MPCVLQVSATGEPTSRKGRSFQQWSGHRLGRQPQAWDPPALHLPQAGVPQVRQAVQLPAPGGQDGKLVYPVPGNQGDNEVRTNRLPYLHKVSETSPSDLGCGQGRVQPHFRPVPSALLLLGGGWGVGVVVLGQGPLRLDLTSVVFVEWMNGYYEYDSIHNLMLW